MTEQQAILMCLEHRDPTGFEYLVAQYRREAFVHAATLLGNAHDAEDACQECFIKAFNAMPRLAKLDQFYPWFYRILRNHCLNLIAKRNVRKRYAARERENTDPADEQTSPTVFVARSEEQQLVKKALVALRPVHREILVMKYFESASYAAIADRIGIPRGTVMSRLYHARRAFRTEYERQRR